MNPDPAYIQCPRCEGHGAYCADCGGVTCDCEDTRYETCTECSGEGGYLDI